MAAPKTQRRTPFTCDADTLQDPGQCLALARRLWDKGQQLVALDVYDQLAQAHPKHAVTVLAEAYDRMCQITPRTRYTLYQSRFFDFAIAPSDTVLDIGSGHMPFPLATHLADISLTDGHTGRAGAAFCHVDGKPVFEVRVESTGFADKQFDFVYCSHVLEHADDPAAACRELMRIGKRGYIETPTKGKDALLGSARISNHRWHVEVVGKTLIFTEYEERDLAGFGVGILMDMHTSPQTDREKAFSALVWLRGDQCNTMLAWDGSFDFQVRRPAQVQVASPVEPQLSPAATRVSANPSPAPDKGRLRLLQVHTFYPSYLHEFYTRRPQLAQAPSAEQVRALHQDGFSAVHMLAEHLGPLGYEAKLVVANNRAAQHAWAFEQGLDWRGRVPSDADILLAQVEEFKPDVLYCSDPITYDSAFIRRLSHRPRLVLGWRAANIPHTWDASEFDIFLSCLEGLRAKALEMGARHAAYFHPGFPGFLREAVGHVAVEHDVGFCGQVNASQYRHRTAHLHLLAEACVQDRFRLGLNLSGDLAAATPLLRALNRGPCFGLAMYRALRASRIVFDVRGDIGLVGPDGKAQDLAGRQTGNMRIFETTGVGGFLLTPHFDNVEDFFQPGREIETYSDEQELLAKIDYYLAHEDQRREVAARGLERSRRDHSMEVRVKDFDALIRAKLDPTNPAVPSAANISAPQPPSPKVASVPPSIDAEALANRLKRMANRNLPSASLAPLVDDVLRLSRQFIATHEFRSALHLVCAAKYLSVPVRDLDFLRAQAFQGLGDVASAREALKEELRYFPENGQARDLLRNLPEVGNEPLVSAPAEFLELLALIRPSTMLSPQRLLSLYRLARLACEEDLPGNMVECGVAAGGSSALLAGVMARHSRRQRWLYSFDTFTGMPPADERDTHGSHSADAIGWGQGTCAAPIESLLAAAQATGGRELVVPVRGLFSDTLPRLAPAIGSIALLHMDGDWYSSTSDILVHLYDRVVAGGLIQIDDFGFWQGCRQAVEDFAAARKLRLEVQTIDDTGVWLRKP